MGIFDGIFNNKPQQDAANAQIAGLNAGYTDASGALNTGVANANKDYAAALAPYATNLQTDQAGQGAYADATGANGQAGYERAVKNFHAGPGYDWALNQGSQNIMRNMSATGQLGSGATLVALDKYGQGLADQQWQNYLKGLLPFVGQSTANAGGNAMVEGEKANTGTNAANTLANLVWSRDTGRGTAQANADLAQAQANGNILGFGMNLAKGIAGFLP